MPNPSFEHETLTPLLERVDKERARSAISEFGWTLSNESPPDSETPELVWITTSLALVREYPRVNFIDDRAVDLSYFLFYQTERWMDRVRQKLPILTWEQLAESVPRLVTEAGSQDSSALRRAVRGLDYAASPKREERVFDALTAALSPKLHAAVLTVSCDAAMKFGWPELRPFLERILDEADDTEVRVYAAACLALDVWGPSSGSPALG